MFTSDDLLDVLKALRGGAKSKGAAPSIGFRPAAVRLRLEFLALGIASPLEPPAFVGGPVSARPACVRQLSVHPFPALVEGWSLGF